MTKPSRMADPAYSLIRRWPLTIAVAVLLVTAVLCLIFLPRHPAGYSVTGGLAVALFTAFRLERHDRR